VVLLLAAKREAALAYLPRENHPWNADHFRFDFEAFLFLFAHFRIKAAAVIAFGTAMTAPRLAKTLASGNWGSARQLRGDGH
jgi:hypothetical protein